MIEPLPHRSHTTPQSPPPLCAHSCLKTCHLPFASSPKSSPSSSSLSTLSLSLLFFFPQWVLLQTTRGRSTCSKSSSSATPPSVNPTCSPAMPETSSACTQRPPSGSSSRPKPSKSTARKSRPRFGTPPDKRGSAPSHPPTTAAPLAHLSSMTSAGGRLSTVFRGGSMSSRVWSFFPLILSVF